MIRYGDAKAPYPKVIEVSLWINHDFWIHKICVIPEECRIGPPPFGIGEECRIGLPTVSTSTLSDVYKRPPPGLK